MSRERELAAVVAKERRDASARRRWVRQRSRQVQAYWSAHPGQLARQAQRRQEA